ncbi:hypothetical protein AGDE_01339 [Angomonas deanei]|nr:hypothetical protein AGDE_10075 [Angomonas deanei]EPY42584.1 hypothetical protein AGDE_01339 [Angomonas deanei]|eukprot:EPY29200.1 hypothetical protein AGDE_10075 [Angomonas deanei]
MRRRATLLAPKDFDAWAYDIHWPKDNQKLPLKGSVQLTVEDIKFAYNAWSLLRLALFFGTEYPKVLSPLSGTTPSMDIARGGNRLFHTYVHTAAPLSKARTRVALTPQHPEAQSVQQFDWASVTNGASGGVEIVLGMENGLTEETVRKCDKCVYIPQYGSIGSLSMMSALAIGAHSAYRGFFGDGAPPSDHTLGHMPRSNNPIQRPGTLPHESDLLHLSNDEIITLLRERRSYYPLQIAVAMHNAYADRNISAVMRNGNAYNIEKFFMLNRRKHNRRGAVGTQKLLDIEYSDTIPAAALQEYEVWLLYPYYPYLRCYGCGPDSPELTYLRPDSPDLVAYQSTIHGLNDSHPLVKLYPHLARTELFLDDSPSLFRAVKEVRRRNKKGILLAVPEEGTSPHHTLASHASRTVFVAQPCHIDPTVQRGLNPALSTAIAFERIRSAIDALLHI